jgi:hypothetical protein
MTDEDIEKKRSELLGQLYAVGYRHPFPTPEAIAARNAEMSRIQALIDALPKAPPRVTGEAAGIVAIGRGFLGDPWSAPPPEEPYDPDDDDSWVREFGKGIK